MRTLALRRCARVLRSKPRHGHVLRLRGRVGQRRTGSTDRDGSDPPVRGPGTGSEAGVFAHPCPRPLGVAPGQLSLRGKAVQRRFEAAEHQFAGPLSVGLSDIAEQGRGRDGRGRSPRRQAWDAPVLGTQKAFPHGIPGRSDPLRRVGWGVHIRTLPDAVLGIQRGGSLRSRPQAPERHRRSGDRGATAKQPATYGTAGAHIATVVPCTCTSMSMCTRGTPRTPGDRRSRSAPRAALDTSAKQPSHHSAGLVNREAPARRVIGSERPERRKARRTRNRPSGEDAFSARSFRRADRAVHHRGGIE